MNDRYPPGRPCFTMEPDSRERGAKASADPMNLYRPIVRILAVFSHLYFTEIRAVGQQRIPESGPVIFAANHPTSILDAILLAMQNRRKIHFLAKSGLFRKRIVAALLYSVGAIPVYRARETGDAGSRNVEVFERVYELFEAGGCLGIFPEGSNSPERGVGELRSGTARMALDAEARNDYALGLTIVPVGLNYENRELFMSAVFLRYAVPIRVADYAELHRQDPEEAVDRLTRRMQDALRRETLHVENDQIRTLAADLDRVLGTEPLQTLARDDFPEGEHKASSRIKRWAWSLLEWYRPDRGETEPSMDTRLSNREQLMDVLGRAVEQDPEALPVLRRQVDRYLAHLQQTQLSRSAGQSLNEPVRQRLLRLRMTIYVVAMAPLALFGLIHNAIPYLFTRYTARLYRDDAIRAFAYFGIGFLAFTISYAGFGFWLWYAAHASWKGVLVYLALLPPTGFITLRYRRDILVYRDKILVRRFFWNHQELVQLLRRERQELIERLRALAG